MNSRKKKLLHLVQDSFFTDFVINHFEDANPDLNDYVYLSLYKTKLKYIKKTTHVKVITIFSSGFIKLLSKTKNYKALMLHFLSPLKAWFVIFSSKKPKLVWFAWGSDFYNIIEQLRKNLYQSETKKLFRKYIKYKWCTREVIAPFLMSIFNPVKYIIGKVDYCLPVFYEDYELIRKYFKKDTKYLPFSYAGINRNEDFLPSSSEKSNILLGNSAMPSNNHLEILQLLSGFDLSDRKLITPLSYGYKKYKRIIIKKCPEELKNNFYPLTGFLPKNEYLELLDSCGLAIFNYNRQQGLGNIIELLANGCKIYLSENTTTWVFLKRLGIKVFSIESDLKIENKDVFIPLNYELQIRNKEIIEREYSLENVNEKTNNCIKLIYQEY